MALPTWRAISSSVPLSVERFGKLWSNIASRRVMARSCSGWANRPRVMFVQPEVKVGAGLSTTSGRI
ncbi:MAG: hypothetical protein ACRDZR_05420, partial [Acidimicrobiales bacterium]